MKVLYHKRIKLKKLKNARDLGGMPTMDGRRIKKGKLIRCAKLSNLPLSTRMALKEMGVTTVVDLRIPAECSDHPDTPPENTRYVHSPLLCSPTPGITADKSMYRTLRKEGRTLTQEYESMDEYMQKMYLNILMDSRAKAEIKKFLTIVEEEDGCILWHCTSGKDRAGICAMLVESLLGVSEETILDDYLLSRKFWRKKYFLNRLGLMIVPGFGGIKKVLRAFMQIKREYMEGVMQELKERYGSVVDYCKEELGVTDESIEALQEKYLEPIPEEEIEQK